MQGSKELGTELDGLRDYQGSIGVFCAPVKADIRGRTWVDLHRKSRLTIGESVRPSSFYLLLFVLLSNGARSVNRARKVDARECFV